MTEKPATTAKRSELFRVSYMLALGLVGWVAVVASTLVPPSSHFPGWEPFAMFLLVVVIGRSMAFQIFPRAVVTPDTAFYVAAAVALGTVYAAWIVALALTVDALLRHFRERLSRRRARSQPQSFGDAAFPFYYGGISGALFLGVSWLFELDARHLVASPEAQSTVLWIVPAYGLTFLTLHYALQGVRLYLEGHAANDVMRGMIIPGIVVESTLLPLSVATVLLYRPDQPLTLMLLGTTYLLINFVFNRLSRTSTDLRHRVDELQTLHRTGRALASSLELPRIVERVCRETADVVSAARSVALSIYDEDGEVMQADVFDRTRDTFIREIRRPTGSLEKRVLAEGETLQLYDVRGERGAETLADAGVGSWVAVPLRMYDRVVGLIEARSPSPNAFGEDEVRLLQAIAAQASMAIQNARLYELATVDGLTSLYVRRYFDQRLEEEWQRARRFEHAFSLFVMDLDNFKEINDHAGHPAGDAVLREAARALRQSLRGIDIAARYGGEEFAVILPRARLLEAHAVAERVRNDLKALVIPHDGRSLTVTASLGVACYPESGAEHAGRLLELADLALYRAKAAGKNRVELAWPPGDVRHTPPPESAPAQRSS